MDKYTVDLDQVLNDFEYSELTDQYNNSPAWNAAGTTSSSSNQNGVTKHSITNVFHSLNEYLNTNINVDGLSRVDNNLLGDKANVKDVTVLNGNQAQLKDGDKSIIDSNFKTDDILVDLSKDISEHGLNLSRGEKDDKTLDSNEEIKEVCIENTVACDLNVSGNKVKELPELAHKEENAEIIHEEEISKLENENENVKTDVKNTDYENIVHTEVITSIIDLQDEKTVEQENEKSEDSKEEQVDIDPPKASVTKIGFNDDLNLDDSEINKLLEELENEEEGSVKEEVKESQVINAVNDTESKDIEGSGEVKVNQGKDEIINKEFEDGAVIEDAETICEQDKEVVEAPPQDLEINNTVDLVENLNEDVEERLERNNEVEDNLVPIEEPVTSQIVEEVSVPATTEIDSSKNVINEATIELVKEQKSEEKEKVTSENIEKEVSQESLSRPQNLPLKGEGDEPKRKIDLIGDPGSTPYNNVYINKEIPKNTDKTYDSDTDYSTSSSPTFSDVSSTASTVSVDDVENKNDKEPIAKNVSNNNAETTNTKDSNEEKEKIAEEPVSRADESSNNNSASLESAGQENPTSDQVENRNMSNENVVEEVTFRIESERERLWKYGHDNPLDIINEARLGKEAPLWIPDSDAMSCLHCDMKFTVLKRRHHCRACGLVLCSKCCHLRFRLQYLEAEARVCNKCHNILNGREGNSSSGSDLSPEGGNSPSYRPNPNNPLEYCSTVSPLQQVAGNNPNPPAVMVPVGVLKRKGSNKGKSNKSVMFCDGIRPGSDLTNLDNDFDYNSTKTRKSEKPNNAPVKVNVNLPQVDPDTKTFIPSNENHLPPTMSVCKLDISYLECINGPNVVDTLKNEQLTFAIHVSLYVHLRLINMSCCINKMAWCFTTEGLINVGQDEIVILLEYIDEESYVPKDVFYHINNIYNDAVKGTSVKEMGLSLHDKSTFLDSKNHAGFVYIRPTFQCLENVIKPNDPYLIGILIHRWETPWAKLFPLRLILRLGAEYRYYPSPIISTRHRESVFVEIGHTIINLLADFRNFSYTLPQIRGLTIHMEDKNTTLTIPVNRYDQVMKSMNNSSDHILAFAGNFSLQADSHLVCIQDTQGNENCYSTHAINIHNKPRKITGASFIVFNGALKSSSGLTAKSNIVEDGLMIQVLPEHMEQIRESLRTMKNHTISCGCVNAASDETVNIVWGENDVNFNIGVTSSVDNMPLNGIPSIRVHNGKNHLCVNGSRIIRWTEVFIIQNGEDNPKNQDPIDISRVSESIAKATCDALVKYLDLLIANNCQKIGIRVNLHVENVSYLAGSNGAKLPPIYMKSLDNELIPVLHRITSNNLGENVIVLELIFRILNV